MAGKSPKSPPNTRAGRHYKDDEIANALRAANGLISKAASKLHCDPKTIRNRIAKTPALADVLTEAREALIDKAEHALAEAIDRGEGWAVTLTLKTLGKPRGYVERQEITGADGGVIRVVYDDVPLPDGA